MSIGGDSTSDRAEPTLDATDDDPESAPSDSATTTPQPELVEATCTGDDIQFAIDGVAAVADGILLELVADNSCEHSLAIDEDYRITLGTELGPLFSEVPVQLATTGSLGGEPDQWDEPRPHIPPTDGGERRRL
ncbi:MAG: hypothetical protein IPH38_15390 [Candidatus Microthrix sp.]|nr:hypothetical protein [Candidatus Microthrix sp.]MBK7020933.1 hypothetical protein [Candidatus Microthrix sp.]